MIGFQCLYLGIDAESASEDAEVSYVTSKAADNVSPFTSIIVIASGTKPVPGTVTDADTGFEV